MSRPHQATVNYHLQKITQGLYHFHRLGGEEWTTLPAQFKSMESQLLNYIRLNHDIKKLPDFNKEVTHLTAELFDQLTHLSKQTWLQQAHSAEAALIQLKPDQQQLEEAWSEARKTLRKRLGKRIIPYFTLTEKIISGSISPTTTRAHIPNLMNIPISPPNQNYREFSVFNPTPFENFLSQLKNSGRITYPQVGQGPHIKAQGDKDPLSNFYHHPIKFLNHRFNSNEQAYQFCKAIFLEEFEIAHTIRLVNDSYKIKEQGNILNKKASQRKKEEWDCIKEHVVERLLSIKADSCPAFFNKLVESAPKPIIHTVKDLFWGQIYDTQNNRWKGQNKFGKLLMALRLKLNQRWMDLLKPADNTPAPVPSEEEDINTQVFSETAEDDVNTQVLPNYASPPSTPSRQTPTNNQPLVSNTHEQNTQTETSPPASPLYSQIVSQTTPSSPLSRIIGPQSHNHPQRDKRNWSLPNFNEKVVFLGDSNLNRCTMTPDKMKSLEIHSFPGALPSHFTQMFRSDQKAHLNTKWAVLSVGINSRNNKIETNEDQIKKLLSQFHKWQPRINKAISLIQIDEKHFGQKTLETIEHMNTLIKKLATKHNIALLEFIPDNEFKTTGKENIHWTTETANTILTTWAISLNYLRPRHNAPPQ